MVFNAFRRLFRLGGGRTTAAPITASHPLILSLTTLKFLAASHLIWMYGYDVNPAAGASMLPTFDIYGQWLLNSRYHRRGRDIRVGDVVSYRIPIFENVRGVKRVLGMPGDYVLVTTPNDGAKRGGETMIQVPQGHCWLVGDNLEASRDSRYYGPVPLALIEGKVIAKILPWNDKAWVRNGFDEAADR